MLPMKNKIPDYASLITHYGEEAIVGCLKSRLKVAGEQLKIPPFHHKRDITLDITGTTHV